MVSNALPPVVTAFVALPLKELLMPVRGWGYRGRGEEEEIESIRFPGRHLTEAFQAIIRNKYGFELLEFHSASFTNHVEWKNKVDSIEYSQFRMNCVKTLTSKMIK